MTLNEWIVKGETGISSKTMWAAITGAVSGGKKAYNFNVPQDPDDFRRCLKFVTDCGVSASDLNKVSAVFPWFVPFIDNWSKMVSLWVEESPSGKCPKLYDFMQKLEEESMLLAGYVKTGPHSWKIGNSQTFKITI